MAFSSEQEYRTARLRLRQVVIADAVEIARLANDPIIARMTTRIPYPYELAHATGWLNGLPESNETAFAALEGPRVVGVGGLSMHTPQRAEIGYWVGAAYRRRGFAKEIAGALIDFAFSRAGVEELIVSHFIDNPASERVIKSFNFTFLEHIDQWSAGRGTRVASAVYLMTRDAAQLRHEG